MPNADMEVLNSTTMLQPSIFPENYVEVTVRSSSPALLVYVRMVLCCMLVLGGSKSTRAQQPCKSLDTMLMRLTIITRDLPSDLKNAWSRFPGEQVELFDTIAALFTSGSKELAEQAGRRSAILNSYAGYQEANVLPFSPLPVNQKLEDFFVKQGYKIEMLDRSMNSFLKSPDRTAYQRLGYVAAYDSAYQKRLPQFKKYSTAVIAQVMEEIHFLQTNQHLLKSKDEQVRIKYLEMYLKVLGRLLNLNSTAQRFLIKDGAEIYAFCQRYPATCEKYSQ